MGQAQISMISLKDSAFKKCIDLLERVLAVM